jgi:TonB-dependent starch-binding outer membrane protein SusC
MKKLKLVLQGQWLLMLLLLHSLSAPAQVNNLISGIVNDEDGRALNGVSVSVKGTSIGTITDPKGHFTIQVEKGQSLLFSGVGFETQEIEYKGERAINVKLSSFSKSMSDVVVIGYGTTTKKEVTGAVTSLKANDFNKGAVLNPIGLIQGKVPGLAITRTSGSDPNGGYQILLRGVNTLAGGKQPLIIVDGIVGTNTLDMLDPNEIESVDVLKDGSAAAIYGTRATNGVILVTTKRAKVGKVSYEFSSQVSTEILSEHTRFFKPGEYREVVNKYYPNLVQTLDKGQSTNWLDEITRKPLRQLYSFSATGGTENLKFRANMYYKDDEGIVKKTGAKTMTPSLFVSSTGLNGRLVIDARLMYSFIQREGADNNNAIFQAVVKNPTEPVYDPNDVAHGGYYTVINSSGHLNPVAMINEHTNNIEEQIFAGDVVLSYKILNALKANVHYSYNSNQNYQGTYFTKYYPELGTNGDATVSTSFNHNILFEPGLEYKRMVGEHNIQAVAGYSYFENQNEGLGAHNYDFAVEDFSYNNIGAGSALGSGLADMNSNKNSNRLIAFYGRMMYNYKEKYLLSASARYEGSSRFGNENKWGLFPSISAGWRISEENFAKNLSWLSSLKLRAGYGVTGNQDIANYLSLSRIQTTDRLFYYNGQWLNTYAPASNPNPGLKWEKKGEFDVGLDFGLLKNRISGTFDFYSRKVSDLLWNYDVPVPPNVYPTTFANVGLMENHGVELSLSADVIEGKNVNWNTTVLYSQNKNKLVSFSDAVRGYKLDYLKVNPVNGTWSQLILEGQPLGNFVAPVYIGLDNSGEAIYKDFNGDGKIDVGSQDDRAVVGNAYPKFTLGWTNEIRYKQFDFSFFFRGVVGHSLVNYERALYENWKSLVNGTNIVKTTLDNPGYQGINVFDSRYVEKASYVKLEYVTIGHNFKMNKQNILRVYATAQNLLTITNYKGVDPEVPISNFDLRPAVNGIENLNYYPYTRTFLLGVNIKF